MLVSLTNCGYLYEGNTYITDYLLEICSKQLENQTTKMMKLTTSNHEMQNKLYKFIDDNQLEKNHSYKLFFKNTNIKKSIYVDSYIKPDGVYYLFWSNNTSELVKKSDLINIEESYYLVGNRLIEIINISCKDFLKEREKEEEYLYEVKTIIIETNYYMALKLTYQNINIKHLDYHLDSKQDFIRIEINAAYNFIYSFLKINMDQISIIKIDDDLLNDIKKYFSNADKRLTNIRGN